MAATKATVKAPSTTSTRASISRKAQKEQDQRLQQARRASILLKHVSDPTRLQVILILSEGERHVGALCSQLSQSQPAVSHHLALLRVAGLIAPRKAGKHNFYRLQRRRFQRAMEQLGAAVPAAPAGGFEPEPYAPENGDVH